MQFVRSGHIDKFWRFFAIKADKLHQLNLWLRIFMNFCNSWNQSTISSLNFVFVFNCKSDATSSVDQQAALFFDKMIRPIFFICRKVDPENLSMGLFFRMRVLIWEQDLKSAAESSTSKLFDRSIVSAFPNTVEWSYCS